MSTQNQDRYIEEDEINLRELFMTLYNKKKFIILFTTIITFLSIIFVLTRTPIYEAKGLIEIGSYKTNNNNNNLQLDNNLQLSKKLNVLYIDLLKNEKDRQSEISKISIPKGSKEFIEITSLSTSNELAIKEINKIVLFIQKKHQIILDDVNKRRNTEINNLTSHIKNINEVEVKTYEKSISLQESTLKLYRKELESINSIIKKIETKDSSLTALKLMEKSQILKSSAELEVQLFEIKTQFNELKTTTLNELQEKRNTLKSLLLSHNYKNSEIVGKIIINDYSIKPKKKIIVLVSFVIGFFLSLFLVLIIDYISSIKDNNQYINDRKKINEK